MKKSTIVTSGKKYLDIDAYASIFAYRELLRACGFDAYAFSSAKVNESISPLILDLGFTFDSFPNDSQLEYIVLDVSNPDFFEEFVEVDKIAEIIDHHEGYEKYWTDKKVPHYIEFIGSVCTIVYERIIAHGKKDILTPALCKLLTAGILDNTLNFASTITSDRDRKAYSSLLEIGHLPIDWSDIYFSSCYDQMDIVSSLKESIKIEHICEFLPDVFAQIIVPGIDYFLNYLDEVEETFCVYDEWIINVLSLNDGKSYILSGKKEISKKLSELFPTSEKIDKFIVLTPCMLRKEIMAHARSIKN